MKPAVGRIVHYWNIKGEGPFAAIVTESEVDEEAIRLTIFQGSGSYTDAVVEGPIEGEGYWVWPPRQPE